MGFYQPFSSMKLPKAVRFLQQPCRLLVSTDLDQWLPLENSRFLAEPNATVGSSEEAQSNTNAHQRKEVSF
ncbi:hypothetical protein EI555_017283 [Monodon monoceros]|uniref:Uncharacterized protein n=1 Tax=Monodon monoceros TaxID=40151 RepID=A0A4U1EKY2_MONMO|nr:hypothetical protein EI555_017283 [Monodon monoceros]